MKKAMSFLISVSIEKGCYIHIKIDGECFLSDLHSAILNSIDFDDDHLHVFFMNNKAWDDSEAYYIDCDEIEQNNLPTNKIKLNKLGLVKGSKFKYVFDFGDEWKFQCKILQVFEENTQEITIVRSVGEPPIQYDCFEEEESIDEYDAQQADKLYSELNFSEETLELLKDYFSAYSNLYERITLKKALSIFESQNYKIDKEEFYSFAEIIGKDKRTNCFILDEAEIYDDVEPSAWEDKFIVDESCILVPDVYEEIAEKQGTKPYYVPQKDELLKYADNMYFEQPKSFISLQNFLSSKFKLENAYDIADEIQLMCSLDHELKEVLARIQMMGLKFKNNKQAIEFCDYYEELSKNVRKSSNRGFTQAELDKKFIMQEKETFAFGTKNVNNNLNLFAKPMNTQTNRKIGRNEPCPCGSGKKYKKCCGK